MPAFGLNPLRWLVHAMSPPRLRSGTTRPNRPPHSRPFTLLRAAPQHLALLLNCALDQHNDTLSAILLFTDEHDPAYVAAFC